MPAHGVGEYPQEEHNMSLQGVIRMGANALQANQIAVQVCGQNIANVNTPGYIREEAILETAPAQDFGRFSLGLGVMVDAVVMQIDQFLEDQLRGSVSEVAGWEQLEYAYTQLQTILGELADSDLSTALTNFFSSISEVLNQPESVSARQNAVISGVTLSDHMRQIRERVINYRDDCDRKVELLGDDVNRLVSTIAELNIQIATIEAGSSSGSDAVGLRDQRLKALEELSEIVDIRVAIQQSGGVNVYCGGDYLVFEGLYRTVEIVTGESHGQTVSYLEMAETGRRLDAQSGSLVGLYDGRDDVCGTFVEEWDDLGATLIYEFNKIYSGGQGLVGYETLTSDIAVDDPDAALNNADLDFTPTNGSFEILLTNTKTDITTKSIVKVDLTGQGHDTTLNSLAAAINDVGGISAEVTAGDRLKIEATDPNEQFAFAEDTSGVLAALGLNVFFTGSSAENIDVDQDVVDNPSLFAASRGGIAADSDNALLLADFNDMPIESQNGESLVAMYDSIVGTLAQMGHACSMQTETASVYENSLRSEKLAISGVNLDEEAIKLISYQQAYQASARLISTVNELMDTLLAL